MDNSNNFNAVWLELMGKLNPEFAQNNGELIQSFLKTMHDQQSESKTDEHTINLKEAGFESPEEFNELLDLVPKYNDLIEEFEDVENEVGTLRNEIQKVKKNNAQLVRTLQKAKQTIGSLNRSAGKLKAQNQTLNIELKTKNQFLNNMNSFAKPQI